MMADDEDMPPAEDQIPLDDWCRGLSQADRRVELIAVFAYRERAAGRYHDKPSAYAARFAAVHSSPTAA